VPALRALRAGLPDHEVVLAAPRSLAPLVRLTGAVDRLLPAGALEPVAWTGEPPGVAVNLHGRGPQSHRLLQGLRPRRLVAFGCPDAGYDGPDWDDDEHETHRWCRLLTEALGLVADPTDLVLRAPEPPLSPVQVAAVVVHPGAAYPARRWPPERFAEVARALAADGNRVVVTGGADEVPLARAVAHRAGLPDEAVLAGRTDLRQLAALVASASLVLCGDTGLAHVASAFATPSVLLFGPMPPSRWGPPATGPHEVVWHGSGPGDPWGAEVDPALLRVEVDEVLRRCRERLALSASSTAGS
jgi:ADP-heptose:LPS heptosyltransferase